MSRDNSDPVDDEGKRPFLRAPHHKPDSKTDQASDTAVDSRQALAAYGAPSPAPSAYRSEPAREGNPQRLTERTGPAQTAGQRPADPQKAVAIKQEGPTGPTRLIAKGQGALAEQIIQTAFDRGIKVRSDADLTEILAAVDLDSEIPLAALATIAEILSYIYRSNAAPEVTP
tara:strand:+ start:155 stop:670 length:516 start_codon:yes stop_codon:yes gene_type:complete